MVATANQTFFRAAARLADDDIIGVGVEVGAGVSLRYKISTFADGNLFEGELSCSFESSQRNFEFCSSENFNQKYSCEEPHSSKEKVLLGKKRS